MGLARYFSFEGRARRSEFWATQLIAIGVVIAYVIALIAGVGIARADPAGTGASMVSTLVLSLLTIVVVVFWFWIHLAVGVRRAHDRGRPGSFLLWGLVPGVGHWILFVELGFMDSTHGPNAWGPCEKYPVREPGAID